MKLSDIKMGYEYWHARHGRVLVLASHPMDGACLVIQRQETTDPDDDDHVYDNCEASDLTAVEGSAWPYLGFTTHARSLAQSKVFGEASGFEETPPGSGLWYYPDGTLVPHDEWLAAWRKHHNPTPESDA